MKNHFIMDRGSIITRFDQLYGEVLDHEVIKLVLQSCEWDEYNAAQTLGNMVNQGESSHSNQTSHSSFPKSMHLFEKTKSYSNATSVTKSEINPTNMKHSDFGKVSSKQVHVNSKVASVKHTMNEQKLMIILRGLPGSGKSTLAQSLCTGNGVIHSTDYFFTDYYGNYFFRPNQLSEAHEWNKNETCFSMRRNRTPIIIDNTNTQMWEMKPYADLAKQYGYKIEIREPMTPWKFDPRQLSRKTKHSVPCSKIELMLERYEKNITVSDLCYSSANYDKLPRNESSFNRILPLSLPCNSESTFPETISGSPFSSNNSGNTFTTPSHRKKKRNKKSTKVGEDVVPLESVLPSSTSDKKNQSSLQQSSRSKELQPTEMKGSDSTSSKDHVSIWDSYLLEAHEPASSEYSSETSGRIIVESKDVSTQSNLAMDTDADFIICASCNEYVPCEKQVEYAVDQMHAACQTEDANSNEVSKSSSLKTLVKLFPSVPITDLTEFFVRCHHDIDWTTDLLIDSGYNMVTDFEQEDELNTSPELNDSFLEDLCSNFSESCKTVTAKSESSGSSSLDRTSSTKSKNPSTDEDYDLKTLSSFSDEVPKRYAFDEDLDEQVLLTLDEKFASSILQKFGPINNLTSDSELNDSSRTIVLPMSLCKEIHGYWCATNSGIFTEDLNKIRTIQSDEKLARELQEKENEDYSSAEHSSQNISTGISEDDVPYSFQEIVDLETAIFESVPLPKENKETYSAVLKKLKKEYKPVRKLAVEQKFKNIQSSQKIQEKGQQSTSSGLDSLSYDDRSQEILTYRSAAQDHYQQRKKYLLASREAFRKKQYGAASYYAQQGNECSRKLKKANKEASENIVAALNEATRNKTVLDLHFLHVPEAIQATKNFLEVKSQSVASQKNQTIMVQIVTGRGLHSQNYISKLKAPIKSFLRQGNYTFHEDESNDGVLCVLLKS